MPILSILKRSRKKNSADLLVVVGDTHPNSLVGLCIPEFRRDDSSTHKPGDAVIKWLWEPWLVFWDEVKSLKNELDGKVYVVFNGDGSDDNKHDKHGLITVNKSDIVRLSVGVHTPAREVADHLFWVRGTEAHAGGAGELEELAARELGAEQDGETGNCSWWWLPLKVGGVSFDIAHHPCSNSLKPWTIPGGAARQAYELYDEYSRSGDPLPQVGLRAHVHHFEDSGDNHGVRVFFTPPWQLCTAYGHRKGRSGRLETIGGLIFTCRGGEYEFQKRFVRPKRRQPWQSS